MCEVFSDDPHAIGDALERLMRDSRRLQSPHYEQWVLIYERLARLRGDHRTAFSGHLDGNLDLILRSLEDEQAETFKSTQKFRDGGALFLQVALSKAWVFSCYELLRTTCDRQVCDNGEPRHQDCGSVDCFGCSALRLKKEFALARMPLAKLEPAGFKPRDPAPVTVRVASAKGDTQSEMTYPGHGRYHPDLLSNEETGSLAWSVFDKARNSGQLIDRRKLSDDFLALPV